MTDALRMLAGFSVGAALLLAVALATLYRNSELPWQSRMAGFVMLGGLALAQHFHLQLAADPDSSVARGYIMVLFLQSLGFYWLLLGVLRPAETWHRIEWLLPVLVLGLAWWMPVRWAIPLSLLLGTAAAMHLALLCHRLRSVRRWFALELKVVLLFAVKGLLLAGAGLLAPGPLGWDGFAAVYTTLIALGFAVVLWLLLAVPDLLPKARDAVVTAYAQSTLGRVDREASLARLKALFEQEHLHRDDSLSLATVAERVGLSAHQLSELINTEFQYGFIRFVRRYRIAEARRLLVDEPQASVLSVGLSVGFASQSSFYVAFKEEVGMVPGQYRRAQLTLRTGSA